MRPEPGSPRDWLARAESNLALAKQSKPAEAFWEDMGFQAQQAAEKALKAVCRQRAVPFRRTHDLDELGKALEESGLEIPAEVKDSAVLTGFALDARYPGLLEPVGEIEFQHAVGIAEAVVAWARGVLGEDAR
ncbi:MAG: HEPN domain-containing protein [Thermoleophilia bacterium]|nr:HEPN domain-containing protein [Thermoleophilia bacterium]